VWNSILASRGDPSRLVADHGGLVGPFNSMVSSPLIGGRIAALGEAIRFSSSVEARLLELAIITVGAHWRSNFEWWAHSRMAAEAGIDAEVIDALAEGRTPTFAKQDEETIHRFASTLLTTTRVSDEDFNAVKAVVGEQGALDLISTIGYYCMISLTLNALAIPLPGGQEPTWPQ
jgi:4-carboxymuconolactone decarboxylase